jgi:hypothetical protein
MKFPLNFDATISRADFVRLLPFATGDSSLRETAEGFAGKGWHLRLTPILPLVIGSIRLERHRVELALDGLTPAAQETFMRRFSQHYQRGGG